MEFNGLRHNRLIRPHTLRDVTVRSNKCVRRVSISATLMSYIDELVMVDAAYLLFVDPTPTNASSSVSTQPSMVESVLDWVARNMQPKPGMMHVEVLFVMKDGTCFHYSTYVGDEANWRSSVDDYYDQQQWHSIPLAFGDDVKHLVDSCSDCRGSPYSISRYMASTRLLGWVSYLLSESPVSPSHCGGLVARIITNSGSNMLAMPSPRYAPSDLYNIACKRRARPVITNKIYDIVEANCQTTSRLFQQSDVELLKIDPAVRAYDMYEYATSLLHSKSTGLTQRDTRSLGWMAARVIQLHKQDLQRQINHSTTTD